MKTTKINKYSNILLKVAFLFVGLIVINTLFAQGPPPDEGGMSVPIDGGILMAILAGSGLITMLFKKKKKED
jgi:membrane protease YdiL (CAAX protease family)